jgi:uracil-DNA glycosylase family 4
MLVGEAPGFREDQDAKPFVGRAGQFLDEVLEEVGLPRNQIFISNAVKCRPEGNATPTNSQIKACKNYLIDEIERVNPEYILAMGNPALYSLTGRSGVTRLQGSWLKTKPEFGDRKVFVTLHPSGILRREFLKPKFMFAMKQFATISSGKTSTAKRDYRLVRTAQDFRKAKADIRAAKEIAWDIENSKGFNPWHGGKLLVVGVCTRPGKVWVFPIDHPQMRVRGKHKIMAFLKEILEAETPKKIAHNQSHERKWMRHFGITPRCDFDTIISAYLLDENSPMGLKPRAKAINGAPNWDEDVDFDAGIPPLKKLYVYNGYDCDETFKLKIHDAAKLNAIPELARLFKFLMMPAAPMLSDIEYRGICVDRDRLNERAILVKRKLWKLEKKLRKHLPKDLITQDRKGRDIIEDEDFGKMKINWGSTKFLGWFLYKYLELPLIELTKSGKMGTREAVLKQLKSKHEAVALIMERREWIGRGTKFLKPWIARALWHSDGSLRLHPRYNLTKTPQDRGKEMGTETGRLSSVDPNWQQVPRESFIRGIATAKPGWKFGQADLSQAEMRIAAWLAEAKSLLRIFREGRDVHLETACEVTGLKPDKVDKETRKKAKAVNFGFLYGMYPKKFQKYALEKYDVVVTIEEAKQARNRYFNHYPELLDWHDRVRRRIASAGYIKSPLGRRRRLPHIYSEDRELRNQAERQAINSPVQATASDFILFGMAIIEKRLDSKYFEWLAQVHDAGLFQYDPKYEDHVCRTIKEVLEHLPTQRYFGCKIGVPIEVEIEVGTHWSEGVKWQG